MISPLRERKEDIVQLAIMFLNRFNKKFGLEKRLSKSTLDNFLSYGWPGNIREMRNIIERHTIISDHDELDIRFDEKTDMIEQDSKNDVFSYPAVGSLPLKSAMDEFEKKYIDSALKECNGNITKAAEVLGIHRTHLYKKLKK
jgi:transcriptional regulator with PAS, ATPase and Fis domain